VKHGEVRKPSERAVGPPPRIYWARTVPPEQLARALALHLAEENCEHVSLRHCPECVVGHLVDVIAHLTGESDPSPS